MRFKDRVSAGQKLAAALLKHELKQPVVFALPRGGVPVAYEVAAALKAPLDLVLVRKIGVPWQPELAAGAVADSEQNLFLNEDVLNGVGLSHAQVVQAAKAEMQEIERRRKLYLKDRAPIDVKGRDVVVVDDGIATGATVRAAVMALKRRGPARVIVATPVAPPETVAELKREADDVVCLSAPEGFFAISAYYDSFHQLSDDEVVALLGKARPDEGPAHGA